MPGIIGMPIMPGIIDAPAAISGVDIMGDIICGIMGIWDNAEVGAGAAVAAAGKQDQVTIVTNGAGAATGCESIKNGLLDVIFNFNAPIQGEIAAQQISELLQHPDRKAGSEKTIFFGPITRVDKTNATGRNCWKPEDIK